MVHIIDHQQLKNIIIESLCICVCQLGAFELASYASPMHAVVYNPAEPRLIATANAKEGVGLWDIRRPKAYVSAAGFLIRYQLLLLTDF